MKRALISLCAMALLGAAKADRIELNGRCPASFRLLEDGTCELVTLYSAYSSPANHGGVRAHISPPAKRYTPKEIDLGRYLFFDPVLSVDGTMSCASCHDPAKGFSDGRKRAVGRSELERAAPTLWNVAFADKYMWDGRAATLEEQAAMPLYSPKEMGATPESVERALRAAPAYQDLFDQAFGQLPTAELASVALAAFESSLISLNSRYDRYAHGDESALSEQEIRGFNAFRGFVARCSQCHIPPLFTDFELAVVGAPADDKGHEDAGAGALSDDPSLYGAFKTPTLRNISRTAPYFQAGQFGTLKEVVEFYNDTRGHAAPQGKPLKIHWHVHMTEGPELSEEDVSDIAAFLLALEDETLSPEIPSRLPSELQQNVRQGMATSGGLK